MNWIRTASRLPPEDVLVHTKIDDERGCRNEQKMCLSGNHWFTSLKKEMYVYYNPTHWAEIEPADEIDRIFHRFPNYTG